MPCGDQSAAQQLVSGDGQVGRRDRPVQPIRKPPNEIIALHGP